MKVFIMTDMEGISGICRCSQVMPNGENYAEGRKYMTWDINACVQGCIEGGAKRIVVRDGHCAGFNVIWEELDENAEYILGRTPEERFGKPDEFDAAILLGYHAMAGTRRATLEHSYSSSEWQNLWMNGKKVGEFGLDAAIFGEHGLPVIMTSGDDKLCKEAKGLIKNIVADQVKEGIHCEGAKLLPMKTAHKKIREGAAAAVRNYKNIKPLKVQYPVKLRLELVSRQEIPFHNPFAKIIDGRTYEIEADSVETAFTRLLIK